MRTRESFARTLCADGDQERFATSIVVTSGAGIGLDLILGECQRRTNTCFTQSLTYHNALGIIRDRGFSTLALAETEDHELDLDRVEAQFRQNLRGYLLSRTDVFESLFRKSRYLHP